jgi:UDP-galactopyranose mutase
VLPRHPNVHYLGSRPYAELPAYLAGWDVCLLPFALNAATRWASPAQTLEYMAAGRPIVSTPIADVAEPYRTVVHLGADPAAFTAACERALRQTEAERERRQAGADAVLSHTSWDRTVAAMERLVAPLLVDGGQAMRGGTRP